VASSQPFSFGEGLKKKEKYIILIVKSPLLGRGFR